jgi:hypothetical protein
MTTLLRDVFDIPERAGVEDYVLRLTDSVAGEGSRHALVDYVVTPALVDAFDQALDLVSNAVSTSLNRGAFLAGSFGSGKSHFMAVLHALLRQVPEARAITELQDAVVKHDTVLGGKKILPLAFHFLDAPSMEHVLFGSYIRQVQELHPDAPLPAFFPSDSLLADAEGLRRQIGDAAFFEGLGGGGGDDEWSGLLGSSSWDAARYEAARAAAPQSSERQELVTALVGSYFTSYSRLTEYVDIDTGIAAMSNHARSLGYDAVVLFLDELVLWLAFAMHTPEFFRRESQKLTKLVEGSYGSLSTPLVSFVARQMDLRKWFADSGASGQQQEALESAFRHQEGRFAKIELGDDNLPYVASKRLLKPRDQAAGHAVDDAFARLDRNPAVWDVLLDGVNADDQHRGSDEKAFRLTYPFAPALVSTLRTLASVMQRDRTALKVMQQMLVDRRDRLSIDDVIPVGDCFDYVVQGQSGAALDPQAAALFRSADQLYKEKLRPVILSANGLAEADLMDQTRLTPAYRADDRLAKTLLLSAVAPKVPALRALTASRLASLNHGSIVSPLRGGEASVVLAKVREWSRQVPEIHVESDPRNPVIRVQLADVDYESIVDKAKGEDNPGRQRELVKQLVGEGLGLDLGDPDAFGAHRQTVTWRGSKREVELVFGNVRDAGWLTDEHFRAGAGAWRFVLDHPFDEENHTATEDIERVERLIARNFLSRTVVWLPKFLSEDSRRDLRRLVILDWLFGGTGERWTSHADHLSEVDREQARGILQAQHSALHESLLKVIQQAYGAASAAPGALLDNPGHDKVLYSLDPSFEPAPPVGATLGAAFQQLVGKAFEATYPAHPRFEPGDAEIKSSELKAVLSHLERAASTAEGRVELQGDPRPVRKLANALNVGFAGETHFLFGDDRFGDWGAELERGLARLGRGANEPVKVSELRAIIEGLQPARGLRDEISDLVIIAWGLLRQRAWFNHGAAQASVPVPGTLQPAMELRSQPMPSQEEWNKARSTAALIFGAANRPYLTPSAVAGLAEDVRSAAQRQRNDANALVGALENAASRLGTDGGARLALARQLASLLDGLQNLHGVALISHLANVQLSATAQEAGKSLTTARDITAAVNAFEWDRLRVISDGARAADARAASAQNILDQLAAALNGHELSHRGVEALKAAERGIFDWLASGRTVPERPSLPVPQPQPGREENEPNGPGDVEIEIPGTRRTAPGGQWVVNRASAESVLTELQSFLNEHPEKKIEIQWRVVG